MNDMLFRVNVWIRPEFCPFYIFFDDVGDILGYIVLGYGAGGVERSRYRITVDTISIYRFIS